MQRFTRRLLPFAVLAPLLAVLTACGGGACGGGITCVPSPSPSPSSSPAVTSAVRQGSFSGLKANYITAVPFTTSAVGKLEIHVDWTFAEDRIGVYVAQGACSFEQLQASQCNLVASSESTVPKPRVLTVGNAAAGSYVLWIGNRGPKQEALSYQVLLTTGGASSASRSPADGPAESVGEFEGVQD